MEGYQFKDSSLMELVERLKVLNSRMAKNIEDLNAEHRNQLSSIEQLGFVDSVPVNGQSVNAAPSQPEAETVYGMFNRELNKLFDLNHYFATQTDDARFIAEALFRQTPGGAPVKDKVVAMQQNPR